jgi:uncharacterized membrane protein YphA (DoxX/SURF4 family)
MLKKIFIFLIIFFGFIYSALAHVGYVVPENEGRLLIGRDFDFIFNVFKNSQNIFLFFSAIFLLFIIYFLVKGNKLLMNYFNTITEKAKSYEELVAWMLRLGLGITFIGAGAARVLVSPVLPAFELLSFLQILLGFFFLIGFLLMPTILLSLFIFFYALFKNFYLLGNLEILASLISLFMFSSAKPGLDDLLGIRSIFFRKSLRNFAPLVLRIGIGLAMMFLAVYEKFLNPHLAEAVVYNYNLSSIIPVSAGMWVVSAGIIEFLVGLFLFLGFFTRLISAIAFIILTFSFFYFGEAVYSHIMLFAALSVLFVTGSGRMSIDGFLRRKKFLD